MQARSFYYRVLKSLCCGVLAVAGIGLTAQILLAAEAAAKYPGLRPMVVVPPEYPAEAMASNLQGYVALEFGTDEMGNVINPTVKESCAWRPPATRETCTADTTFVPSALAALAQWKYAPQVENGASVPRQGVVTILQFQLSDD
jgi:TonB family protein